MNKKTAAAAAAALSRIILISFVILLNMAAISSAANITWSNGASPVDGDWNNTANWTGGVKPNTTSDYARINMAAGPVFSAGRTATAFRIYLEGTNGTITMSDGSLTTVNHIYMAAILTDTATLNMSGGTIDIGGTFYVARDLGSNAIVNLSGGTITCNVLSMRTSGGTGTINITSTGKLVIANDVTATIATHVTNGWIKAYNGAGTVLYDYDITTPGKTTVWATISNKATIPIPTNGAIYVPFSGTNLSWKAGATAASHNVYFGTVLSDVNNANRLLGDLNGNGTVDKNDMLLLAGYWLDDPAGSEPYAGVNDDSIVNFVDYARLSQDWMNMANPVFKGNQTGTTFDPGTLAVGTTYYWRIDEVNGPETIKGDLWNFTTTTVVPDSNYTLVGKIMCGYQGWFNCLSDGTPRGWIHWSNDSAFFTPASCTVDMWPDMNEMGAGEKFLASAFNDGNDYYVFSSYKHDTVLRHFLWMAQYGIDGVYLQRFATELTPGDAAFAHRNAVLSYCKEGANLYGKKYAVMYDLSGLPLGGTQKVIDDWKFLVDTMQVTRDSNDYGYMTHKGKPVVAVWGIGFNGRLYTHAECQTLINFLKNDPCYGGNTVMIGVRDNWRTSTDPNVIAIRNMADIISPWSVGGYGSGGVSSYATNKWVPDKTWCNTNGKEYLPVIWPGFSWSNLKNDPTKLNQYPRYGGQFFWDQVYSTVVTVDANMIYVAMFDEVDEGTAIFKVTNNPPRPDGVNMFVTYSMDGYSKPSDEYLWLTGQATRGLRGEIPVNQTRPVRP